MDDLLWKRAGQNRMCSAGTRARKINVVSDRFRGQKTGKICTLGRSGDVPWMQTHLGGGGSNWNNALGVSGLRDAQRRVSRHNGA